MSWADAAALAQVIATVFVAVTIVLQVRQNREQKRGEAARNVFSLIDYLEREDVIAARLRCRELDPQQFNAWSDKDRKAADLSARAWQVACSLEDLRLLPLAWLHLQYGGAITRSWITLEPYILDLRQRTDPKQRLEFERIHREMQELGWFSDGQPGLPSARTAEKQVKRLKRRRARASQSTLLGST